MEPIHITIKNIRVRTFIGFHEWEKKRKQNLFITFTIEFDPSKLYQSGKLEDTTDYYQLTTEIVSGVEQNNFVLVEHLLDFVLGIIMAKPNIARAEVIIEKPEPIKPYAETILVKGSRSK